MPLPTVSFVMSHAGWWLRGAHAVKREGGNKLYGPAPKGKAFEAQQIRDGRHYGVGTYVPITDQDNLLNFQNQPVQVVLREKDYRVVPCRRAQGEQAVCLVSLVDPLVNDRGCDVCLENLESAKYCVACKAVFGDLVTERLQQMRLENEIQEWKELVHVQRQPIF